VFLPRRLNAFKHPHVCLLRGGPSPCTRVEKREEGGKREKRGRKKKKTGKTKKRENIPTHLFEMDTGLIVLSSSK